MKRITRHTKYIFSIIQKRPNTGCRGRKSGAPKQNKTKEHCDQDFRATVNLAIERITDIADLGIDKFIVAVSMLLFKEKSERI